MWGGSVQPGVTRDLVELDVWASSIDPGLWGGLVEPGVGGYPVSQER